MQSIPQLNITYFRPYAGSRFDNVPLLDQGLSNYYPRQEVLSLHWRM
jgi:hypothetical protein